MDATKEAAHKTEQVATDATVQAQQVASDATVQAQHAGNVSTDSYRSHSTLKQLHYWAKHMNMLSKL